MLTGAGAKYDIKIMLDRVGKANVILYFLEECKWHTSSSSSPVDAQYSHSGRIGLNSNLKSHGVLMAQEAIIKLKGIAPLASKYSYTRVAYRMLTREAIHWTPR